MGSVVKKGSKWAIRFDEPSKNGTRSQKQVGGFLKKKEAENELKRIESLILSGEFLIPSKLTVSEFIEIWMHDHTSNLAPKTKSYYGSFYSTHFKDYFKSIILDDLKAYDIDAFYRHLKNTTPLSVNSIYHAHKMLCTILSRAVKWDYLRTNPMYKVTPPKSEKTKFSFWHPDVIPYAIPLFKNEQMAWMVEVALLTGLRLGEICALHVDNIDFKKMEFKVTQTAQRDGKNGIIFKVPKTDESTASLPMSPQVSDIFKQRISDIRQDKEFHLLIGKKYENKYNGYISVFKNGRIMEPSYVSFRFAKTLKKQTEIPLITFHSLRHSCASWLLYVGVDMKTIQLLLRHSDFKTTANIYSHVAHDVKKDAVSKLKINLK